MKKALKLLTIVCLVAAVCAMASCKKEQDKLIGTWKVNSCVVTPDPTDAETTIAQQNVGGIFTFKSDNSLTATDPLGGSANGTFTYSDKKLTTIVEGDTSEFEVTSIDTKALVMTRPLAIHHKDSADTYKTMTFTCAKQ